MISFDPNPKTNLYTSIPVYFTKFTNKANNSRIIIDPRKNIPNNLEDTLNRFDSGFFSEDSEITYTTDFKPIEESIMFSVINNLAKECDPLLTQKCSLAVEELKKKNQQIKDLLSRIK
jgi:hypothetical protein